MNLSSIKLGCYVPAEKLAQGPVLQKSGHRSTAGTERTFFLLSQARKTLNTLETVVLLQQAQG